MIDSLDDMVRAVEKFHKLAKQPPPAHCPRPEVIKLRMDLLQEELRELETAASPRIAFGARVEALDAICDILYVLLGTAIAFDLHDRLPEAFWRVHESNMAKFGPGSATRADGKVLKPPGWQPPDLSDLV